MNLHQLTTKYIDEPRFDKNIARGIPFAEMEYALEEIEAAARDLNRKGIRDFEFVKCTLTDPLREVQRSIFPSRSRDATKSPKRTIKLDRNLTYMISFHFRYKGKDLDVAHVRVPYVEEGGKFVMWGKNYFVRSVLVDRGVNLAKNELFIRLDRTSFSMARTTHPFYHNKMLNCDNVLTGNPHHGGNNNKKGKGDDRITAVQNLFLYPLAKYGLTKTLEMFGADLEVVQGNSYEEVFNEYHPRGYSVFGSSGIKTSDGGKVADWKEPDLYLLYKGDLAIGSDEYNVIAIVVANLYYIMDRIPSYLSMDILDDTEFWTNILGRFIFYRADKTGAYYSEQGNTHLVKSIDGLIDGRTHRQLVADGINVSDTYELFIWLILNEREVYANIHPSDVSRKRITSLRYLLSYILDHINRIGYRLEGRTDENGVLDERLNHARLNELIRTWLKEGTIRTLVHKDHGEVETLESPSTNMFITNTRALLDQTKVRGSAKERNHMYNRDNILHGSKLTRCRVDGIDSSTPSGSTQVNPLSVDTSRTTALNIQPWLQAIEDKLNEDLKGDF